MDEEFAWYYDKHYIKLREDGAIIDGWSTGPHPEKDTEGAILINSKASYQFRLILEGGLSEENPSLWTWEGIPKFTWDGEKAVPRPQEDIDAEIAKIPPPPPSPLEVLTGKVAGLDTTTQEAKAKTEDMAADITATQVALCDVYEALLSGMV